MQTIILDTPGQFSLADTTAPEQPKAGEALVRAVRGRVRHRYSRLHGRQPFFSYPRILGHELGVEVVAVGDGVSAVRVGDRCAVEPYLNCGECIARRRGRTNCCAKVLRRCRA